MKHRGAFTVFAAAFAVVLLGGLALAQVGALRPAPAPDTDEVALVAAVDAAAETVEVVDEPIEKTEEPSDTPDDGKVDEPDEGDKPDDGKVDDGDEPDDGKVDDGEGRRWRR